MPSRPDSNPARRAGALASWRRRREEDFNRAIAFLTAPHTPENLPQLRAAAHIVSETLAVHIPMGQEALPRGYRVRENRWGAPAIAFGDVLYSPVYTSPAPTPQQLEHWAKDLRTGWLREVLDATGAALDFKPFAEIEEIKR